MLNCSLVPWPSAPFRSEVEGKNSHVRVEKPQKDRHVRNVYIVHIWQHCTETKAFTAHTSSAPSTTVIARFYFH